MRGGGGRAPPPPRPPAPDGAEALVALKKIVGLNQLAPKAPEKILLPPAFGSAPRREADSQPISQ